MIFYYDDILAEYEQYEEWDKTYEYLNNLMCSRADNKFILYRFAAQCWYVLTFWVCDMPKKKMNKELFELGLKKAYFLAKEWNDSDCLWLFGYFMCINPMVFPYVSIDIREVEEKGNALITKAYHDNPNNQLAEILYLVDNGNKRKYRQALNKCKENIAMYFPHQSEIEKYFYEVFSTTK